MKALWLLALPAVAGCASNDHHASGAALQMNDLSVLLPLPRSQAELDAALPPTAAARGGALLPHAIYAQDSNSGFIPYEQLRVVAFRLDPCFGQTDATTDLASCDNQLRIVLQPIQFDSASNSVLASDSAVHVFYSLTRAELLDAVDDLVAARLADGGTADLGPLAPHPIVASEGLGGALAQSFDTIMTKYAGAANLTRITSLFFLAPGATPGVDEVQAWGLHGNDFANGQATPISIASLPPNTHDEELDTDSSPLATRFTPATTSSDSIVLIANFAQSMQAPSLQRQASFDAALRIENPHFHSPNTIDCASCHMAELSRQLVGEALGLTEAGNANAFVPDAAIPAADLASTTNGVNDDGGLNIHAFSYRITTPMINQRVINETAANLKTVSALR